MKNKDTKNKHTKRYLIGTITGISVASAVIIPPLLTYGCNGETKIQKLNETTHELNIKINSLESTINTLKANLEDKNKKLADITAKYESNNVVLKNAKLKLLEYVGNDDVNFAVDENGNGAIENSLVDKLKKQIANYQDENKKMRLEIKTLKLDISNLQSQLANANAQNYKLKNRIETLILENAKQIALLKEQIATLEQDKAKFKQANNELVEQLAKSSQRISDLEALIKVKDKVIAQNKAEISKLKNSISKLKDDLASALKQYIKQVLAVKNADKDMLEAVESISNEPDTYFTNEDGSINNARDFLKSKFITQSKNTEIENKLNTLAQLDDNKILNYISDTNGIDKSFLAELQNNLDTLKDEYISKFKNNEQAYKEYHDILLQKLSDKDKAIKELNTQLENAKSDLTKLIGSNVIGYIDSLDYNQIDNNSIVGVLNQKLKNKINENEQLKADKINLEKEIEQKNQQISDLNEQKTQLEKQIEQKNAKIQDLETQKVELENTITDKNTRINELKQQKANLEAKIQDKDNQITQLNEEKTKYEDILTKTFGTMDADAVNKALENENADELETGKYKKALERIKELENDKNELEQAKSQLETDNANKDTEIQNLNNDKTQLENTLNQKESEIRNLKRDKSNLESEITNKNQEISQLTNNKNNFKTEVSNLNTKITDYEFVLNKTFNTTNTADITDALNKDVDTNDNIDPISVGKYYDLFKKYKQAYNELNSALSNGNSLSNNVSSLKDKLRELYGSSSIYNQGSNGENVHTSPDNVIARLRSQIESANNTISSLNLQNTTLTNEKNALQSENKRLNSVVNNNQAEIQKYKALLMKLQGSSDLNFDVGENGENAKDGSLIYKIKHQSPDREPGTVRDDELVKAQANIEKYKKKLKELYGTSDVNFVQGDLGENVSNNPESVISRLKDKITTLKNKNNELNSLLNKLSSGETPLWEVEPSLTTVDKNSNEASIYFSKTINSETLNKLKGKKVRLTFYMQDGNTEKITTTDIMNNLNSTFEAYNPGVINIISGGYYQQPSWIHKNYSHNTARFYDEKTLSKIVMTSDAYITNEPHYTGGYPTGVDTVNHPATYGTQTYKAYDLTKKSINNLNNNEFSTSYNGSTLTLNLTDNYSLETNRVENLPENYKLTFPENDTIHMSSYTTLITYEILN